MFGDFIKPNMEVKFKEWGASWGGGGGGGGGGEREV